MSHLIDFLSRILTWVLDLVKYVGQWVWHEILGALIAVLSAIPVPGFLSNAPALIGNIPPSIAFFLQAFELPAGLVMIVAAWGIRFVLRHLPVVGG